MNKYSNGKQFIFLMCSERSGSNLITKLFDAHSAVAGPSTSHLADILLPALPKYGTLSGSNWQRLLGDVVYLLETKNAAWKKSFDLKELSSSVLEGDIAGLLSYVYMQEALASGKSRILIKENRIYEFSQFLAEFYPSAGYLYMMRDPRDMAASWKHSFAIRGGAMRAASVWRQDQQGFMRMLAWSRHRDEIPAFRYEDLVDRPAETLKGACMRLGLEFETSMLDFHQSESARVNALLAADWGNISSPLMTGNYGKYKSRLDECEIRYIEYLCREEMQAFGYECDYPVLNGAELGELEQEVAAREPIQKAAYEKVSDAEKERRRLNHAYASEIRGRPYPSLFSKKQASESDCS